MLMPWFDQGTLAGEGGGSRGLSTGFEAGLSPWSFSDYTTCLSFPLLSSANPIYSAS